MADSVLITRTFVNAIDHLDEKDQLATYKAIVRYGLDGVIPEENTIAKTMLLLAKPTIDNNKKLLERSSYGYREWRKTVLERDSYKCVMCGASGCRLEVHHIKPFAQYPALRLSIDNGMTLCQSCHREVHRK